MDLVDDVDAFPDGRGGKHRLVPERADVVDAVVGGRVQLHHVQHRAVHYPAAGGTLAAGVAVHGMFTVHRPREDTRAGGLTGASGADENIGVREPPGPDLVFQGLGYMLLTDDLIEGLRAPFAIQSLIHLRHLL